MRDNSYDFTTIFNIIIIMFNIYVTIRSTFYITKKEKDLVDIEFQLDKARLKLKYLEKVISKIELISDPEIEYTNEQGFHFVIHNDLHKISYDEYINLFNDNYYLLNSDKVDILRDSINNNKKKIKEIENIINDPYWRRDGDPYSESDYNAQIYLFMQTISKEIKHTFLNEFSRTLNTIFE